MPIKAKKTANGNLSAGTRHYNPLPLSSHLFKTHYFFKYIYKGETYLLPSNSAFIFNFFIRYVFRDSGCFSCKIQIIDHVSTAE